MSIKASTVRAAVVLLFFLTAGCDLGPEQQTALQTAVSSDDDRAVRELLSDGADPNVGQANTPLMEASRQGDLPVMRLLLDAGADINTRSEPGGYTALHYAATTGETAAVGLLLKEGADPCLESDDGETAMDVARVEEHPRTVLPLQEAEASCVDTPK